MDNEYIVIDEAVKITGKHITTIYKAIRRGKLSAIDAIENSKPVKKVRKSELIKLYGIKSIDGYRPSIDNSKDGYRPALDDYRKAIEEVLEAKQSQLMKPIEEQALYRLGRMEQENSFLKAKVETLLQELEQYKSLPGPADVEKMQKENQEKEKDLIIQIEMERKEKEDLLSRGETIQKETEEKLKQSEEIHRKELEARQEEQKELHRQELEQVRKQAEEREKAVIEECKRQLQDYMNKPWYRKLW